MSFAIPNGYSQPLTSASQPSERLKQVHPSSIVLNNDQQVPEKDKEMILSIRSDTKLCVEVILKIHSSFNDDTERRTLGFLEGCSLVV